VGDAAGGARSGRAGTRASDAKNGIRRRAVGTRDRIISYLGAVNDISDPGGMASTRLAAAVSYPGSSVAFAQLLSGMERDGLIAREVRGKRTYRIILAPGVGPGDRRTAGAATAASGSGGGAAREHIAPAVAAAAGMALADVSPRFDYDELARRLLIQVIRRLATPADGHEAVVNGLERELAAARSRASELSAAIHELREQLSQVRRSLDEAGRTLDDAGGGPAGGPAPAVGVTSAGELSDAEVVLLEGLISPAHEPTVSDGITQDATAS
jgi:hypothetical protein